MTNGYACRTNETVLSSSKEGSENGNSRMALNTKGRSGHATSSPRTDDAVSQRDHTVWEMFMN